MKELTNIQTTQPLTTITKTLFTKTALNNNLNYHGSCFIKQSEKFTTINHVLNHVDTANILGHRQLTNTNINSLKFATTNGYSYLSLTGKSLYITMTETPLYQAVFIIIDDIPDTDQTNIVVYSLDR
jgi:hypothetical protein